MPIRLLRLPYFEPMKRLYYFFLALLLGCGGREEEQCVFIPNVSTEAIVLDIEHFEDTLAGITSKNQLVAFLQRGPVPRVWAEKKIETHNDEGVTYIQVRIEARDYCLYFGRSKVGIIVL